MGIDRGKTKSKQVRQCLFPTREADKTHSSRDALHNETTGETPGCFVICQEIRRYFSLNLLETQLAGLLRFTESATCPPRKPAFIYKDRSALYFEVSFNEMCWEVGVESGYIPVCLCFSFLFQTASFLESSSRTTASIQREMSGLGK
ncbi:hypothetical protein SAMN05444955_103166 [Lihuaxuella thermophila]|uniref:Uncharacterized protein n=1 Tax=Lihuaxuella thermophila TaxID=1173111 RepID=A0A1H8CBV5_9BACL|nr:hypothetical protein SAMN05444955_103166 [Lihuaxuella thermophila]